MAGCHYIPMVSLEINKIAIIIVKVIDYSRVVHNISQSDAIHLLKNSVLDGHGYI